MTIMNYLDFILNKNSCNDIVNYFNFKIINNKLISKIEPINININENKQLVNIRRCGVIFIKDFVKNFNHYYKLEDKLKPNKVRKILFVKGKSGYYSFPKGRMQEGENNYECASREVYEETGIKISEHFLKFLPVLKMDNNIYFVCNLNNLTINNGNIEYISDYCNKNFTFEGNVKDYINFWDFNNKYKMDCYEVEEACWYTIEEISNLKCNKDIRNVIKKLNNKKLNIKG